MSDAHKNEQSSQDAGLSRIGSSGLLYQVFYWDTSDQRWIDTCMDADDLNHALDLAEMVWAGDKCKIIEKELITRRIINV